MQGLTTVFGGSGFIGGQIVRALARRGHRLRVAVRRPGRAYRLPMMGDVGQIEIVQANLRDEASVARALEGAEACVNCVGILYQSGHQGFESLHVEGAGRVARVAARSGAGAMVQLSALGADAASPALYGRTKAAGEAAVRAAFPGAVILRPSVVFGPGDGFFNRFAQMAMVGPALPLIGGGATRFQPVFVGDVAAAAARALEDPAMAGKTFELGGPGVYSFTELMRLMLAVIGRKRALIRLSFGAARMIGKLGDVAARLGLPPPLTSDQVELLRADNVVCGTLPGLAELGVTASPVEAIIPTYLWRYRKGGQYAAEEALAALSPSTASRSPCP
ncbi:MAG TPA: complex I NDUFA9 subunit family protein [Caulobacteraceae bacterium]|nr:complex I NDUFA9 subunit family protein [Caulobacteraceae bacterium]